MSFQQTLRNSRLVSLAKQADTKYFTEAQKGPRSQVVKTTAASFHRRNWGLKSPIPAKNQSINIHVRALDSDEGLAQFEPGSGSVRRLERFREFGVPIRFPNSRDGTNLFHINMDPSDQLAYMNKPELNKVFDEAKKRRADYKKYVLAQSSVGLNSGNNSSDSITRKNSGDSALDFLGLRKLSYFNSQPRNNSPTAIGLNYSLKGTMNNTPQGFKNEKVVKGRLVPSVNSSGYKCAAIGGFITNNVYPSNAKFLDVHDFNVRSATVQRGASLEITSYMYVSNNFPKGTRSEFKNIIGSTSKNLS